ncbi:hypothetical protein ACHAWC_005805 [Mediolabrus comicus]
MKRRMEEDNTVDGEKGEIVTHDNNLLEPLDQLAKEREEVAELVKKAKVGGGYNHVNYDIEQNIREIRAILKMNAEILDRCVKFMKTEGGGTTYFCRIMYEVVTTRARSNGTQIITHPKRTDNSFNTEPLSKLPQGLEDIILSSKMTGDKLSSFIDFDAIFKRSLIFHETVLEQFLPKLKEHLMSIQVCLGAIDSWVIQEPQKNITFLEETFQMKMEIPDNNVTLGRDYCVCIRHDPNEICLKCGNWYGGHTTVGQHRRCPHPTNSYFTCEHYQLLKQCTSKGKHETTFDLSKENERTRLNKFLAFIAID